MLRRRPNGAKPKRGVSTLRLFTIGEEQKWSKHRSFIGTEQDLRWLAAILAKRAKLPGKRIEVKTWVDGGSELIDIYEFNKED